MCAATHAPRARTCSAAGSTSSFDRPCDRSHRRRHTYALLHSPHTACTSIHTFTVASYAMMLCANPTPILRSTCTQSARAACVCAMRLAAYPAPPPRARAPSSQTSRAGVVKWAVFRRGAVASTHTHKPVKSRAHEASRHRARTWKTAFASPRFPSEFSKSIGFTCPRAWQARTEHAHTLDLRGRHRRVPCAAS